MPQKLLQGGKYGRRGAGRIWVEAAAVNYMIGSAKGAPAEEEEEPEAEGMSQVSGHASVPIFSELEGRRGRRLEIHVWRPESLRYSNEEWKMR